MKHTVGLFQLDLLNLMLLGDVSSFCLLCYPSKLLLLLHLWIVVQGRLVNEQLLGNDRCTHLGQTLYL